MLKDYSLWNSLIWATEGSCDHPIPTMACPESGNLLSSNTCSICLEPVHDTHKRSIAKLICGHQFHLDCIGSAFNAKGSMQCPNCRHIENGEWLYGNRRVHSENSMPEDVMFEVEFDLVLPGVSEVFLGFMNPESLWFPYQGPYTQSLGDGDHLPIVYGEVVDDWIQRENFGSEESVQPGLAQAPGLSIGTPGDDGHSRVQQNSSHLHPEVPRWEYFTSPSGQWGQQSSAGFEPIGVAGGILWQGGSQWDQSQNQSRWHRLHNQPAGHIQPLQSRHNGRRRRSPASIPAVANMSANQISPRPGSWNHLVIPAVRDTQPRNITNFRQRRRDRSSRFQQYTSEAGLYANGTLGSQLPTQVETLDHHIHASSQVFHPNPSAEYMDAPPSMSPSSTSLQYQR